MKVKPPEGEEEEPAKTGAFKKRDELYESAVDLVVREGRGSVSLLQRALGIGYGRAARLIDFMAEDGIVGQYNGSQARDILITLADWERMQGLSSEEDTGELPVPTARISTTASPPRRNIVKPEPWDNDMDGSAEANARADKSAAAKIDDGESDREDADAEDEYQAESA
jgi:S-DNA-T family DNA segregation ATPase FtsK/SpoIIIE